MVMLQVDQQVRKWKLSWKLNTEFVGAVLIKDDVSVLFNSNNSQILFYVRITVFFIQHLSCDAPGPPTDGALWLEDGLVVLGVVDLSRRQLLVRLVLARAPPLAFGAPPVRL